MRELPDRNNRIPTPKQTAARIRNWGIRCIRAFYHLMPRLLSEEARTQIQKIIDQELKRLGAEPESIRVKRLFEEMLAREREYDEKVGKGSSPE